MMCREVIYWGDLESQLAIIPDDVYGPNDSNIVAASQQRFFNAVKLQFGVKM